MMENSITEENKKEDRDIIRVDDVRYDYQTYADDGEEAEVTHAIRGVDLQIHTPDGMRHLCLFTVIRVRLIIVPHIVNADNVAIFFLIFFSYAVFHHFSHCPAVFSAKFMI